MDPGKLLQVIAYRGSERCGEHSGAAGNDRQVYQGGPPLIAPVASPPGSGPSSTRACAGVPGGGDATETGAAPQVDRSSKDPSGISQSSIPNSVSPNYSWFRCEQEFWTLVQMGNRPNGGNHASG